LPKEAEMIVLAAVIVGAFLVIFATVGVGSPYNKWEPDGDKAVFEALADGKKEGVK
jgi:multisubunit Na+/H+ antiporter MnhG subunit